MAKALLTIRGLYNWDSKIFDLLVLPEDCDRDTAINYILLQCDALNLIYPDWDAMHTLIGHWSVANQYAINGLWETTLLEYNPIENYDRYEEYTDTDKKDETDGKGTTITGHSSATVTPGSTSTTVGSRKAFNETTFSEVDKEVNTAGGVDASAGDSSSTWSGADTHTANNVFTHTAHLHGNIGVTTNQQMITDQRGIVDFNFYMQLGDMFKREFCIMVY